MKGKPNAVFPSSEYDCEQSGFAFMANDPYLELNPGVCHLKRLNPCLSLSLSFSLIYDLFFLKHKYILSLFPSTTKVPEPYPRT